MMALVAVLFAMVVILSAITIAHTRLRWIEWDSRIRTGPLGRTRRPTESEERERLAPSTVAPMASAALDASSEGEQVGAFAEMAGWRPYGGKRRRLRH
jgi:hypothetical protein